MKKKIEPLEILLWVVILILFYMILTRIFGNSATDIQIYLGFLSSFLVVIGFLIGTNNKVSNLNREMGEAKISIKHNFERVRNDVNIIKEDTNKLREDIKRIETKIDNLK